MTGGARPQPGEWQALEQLLTGLASGLPRPVLPSPEQLRRRRLAGYTYGQLPPGHSGRAALRPDHTAALYTHLRARQELRTLLAAWQQVGVTALLFKGFQLAEFVYPSAGQRPYGDVDVQIGAEQAPQALRAARLSGWTEVWHRERSLTPFHHELMTLLSPGGHVQLDVHERLIHNLLPQVERQRRVTRAVRAAAEERDWDGIPVLLPTPADTVLVGTVLNRCWGDDSWRPSPHDLPDLRAVTERGRLGLPELRHRARQLGCPRTLEIFLGCCDPYRNRLRLAPRSRLQALVWGLRVLPERGLLVAEHQLSRGWVAATRLIEVGRELPGVLGVLWALRRRGALADLTRLLPPLTRPRPPHDAFAVQRVVRGVQLALTLLRARLAGDCLPRSLAIAAALRRQGLPAVFCTGVRRDGSRLRSHAWVELDGEPMFDALEPQTAHLYQLSYRAPAGAARGT